MTDVKKDVGTLSQQSDNPKHEEDSESNIKSVGYCDEDWISDIDDRKSASGGCLFLGNNIISWFNKKLNYDEAGFITA